MASQERSVPLETFIKVATEHYVQFPNERTARMLIQMASKIQETESGDKVVIEVPMSDDDSGEESETEYEDDDSDKEMESSDDDSDAEESESDDENHATPMDTSHSPEILLSEQEKDKIYFTHFTQNATKDTLAAWEFARRSIDGCGRVNQRVMLAKFTNDQLYHLLRTNEVYDGGKKIGFYSVADYYCKDQDGAEIELQLKPYFR